MTYNELVTAMRDMLKRARAHGRVRRFRLTVEQAELLYMGAPPDRRQVEYPWHLSFQGVPILIKR